jgi:hypothetical protein
MDDEPMKAHAHLPESFRSTTGRVPRRRGTVPTLFLTLLLALIGPAAAQAQSAACPVPDALVHGAPQPEATVRYLADDALEGRLAGSPGARCAALYIANLFRQAGLEPGVRGAYLQSVPLASAANPHAPAGTGVNVVGVLHGSDPTLAGEAVVIGAHFDHLGRGPFGSLAPDQAGQIHNGADDNASGVAALVLVARELARNRHPGRSVVFVAFTGEEEGLLGSGYYVQHPVVPLDSTVAMLNMDMVGRLRDQRLIVYGMGTSPQWPALVEAADSVAGLQLAFQQAGFGPSDHTSFYGRGIPVLHFFTNLHEDYHRPTDDWQKIDFPGISHVAELVSDIASRVAGRPARLAVVEGIGAPPADSSEGQGYGAYLGTVPDFTFTERGVRFGGITAGSPADRAGLRAGDVMVGFDGRDIEDLYGFTAALRSHAPGDTVAITVLRGQERATVTAVLGDRARDRH